MDIHDQMFQRPLQTTTRADHFRTTIARSIRSSLRLPSSRNPLHDSTHFFLHRTLSRTIQKSPESLRACVFHNRIRLSKRSPYQEIHLRQLALKAPKLQTHIKRLIFESDKNLDEVSLHIYLARRAQGIQLGKELEEEVELEDLCAGMAGLTKQDGDFRDSLEAVATTEWSSEENEDIDSKYVFYEDMSEEDEGESNEDEDRVMGMVELDTQMSAT